MTDITELRALAEAATAKTSTSLHSSHASTHTRRGTVADDYTPTADEIEEFARIKAERDRLHKAITEALAFESVLPAIATEPRRILRAALDRMTTDRQNGCPTCSGPSRETVGMVCQTCGTDYATDRQDGSRS